MKFLLINPTARHWRVGSKAQTRRATRVFRFSMLSSLYVAAAMPPDIETTIVDEEVEPIDFETNAALIGISFMTFNAPRAYELAGVFRKQYGKPVIFGGYHPSLLPDEAIQHADSVCIGEAEANVPQMIRDFRAGRLQPFYRNGSADLRRLPVPNRRLLRRTAYALPEAVQATILTPFPGTPLFRDMEAQGRIIDRDWAHYDFANVVFEPKQMSRETLRAGHRWVLNRFYACSAIARRLLRSMLYLPPSTILRACVPLDFGYRARLRASGILGNGTG
ncbi:MAG: cobalamin B12-binding domain-containing protein [Verrucomicrobia bacterium]|nr:cobalamin B12-binding domain-containing protein [Verrucomicrobiota bacterium]